MAKFATILTQTADAVSFAVDAVEARLDRLPSKPWTTILGERSEGRAFASSHPDTCPIVEVPGHALAIAVHIAFSEHRPLSLSPDLIWITITQGIAQHVMNHAETLRPLFVGHPGKMRLTVPRGSTVDWGSVVAELCAGIEGQVGQETSALFVCNFTTTSPIGKTVSQVVMMEAFQEYFEYALRCICGIPTVTLHGTPADWRELHRRVTQLAAYDCSWWTDRLLPICEELIVTAEGRPSLPFWQNIYKPQDVYGGEVITGWLGDLFPYIKDSVTAAPSVPNPLLVTSRADVRVQDGIQIKDLPNGLSRAPFSQTWPDGTIEHAEIVAGFIGISQDPATGAVQPALGWWVALQSPMVQLVESLPGARQGQAKTSAPDILGSMTRELVELVARRGGTMLFAETGHPWKLYTFGECRDCEPTQSYRPGICFGELNDGRVVAEWAIPSYSKAFTKKVRHSCVAVGRVVETERNTLPSIRLEEPIIIAQDLPDFLNKLVDAQGKYYFDAEDFQPELSFSEFTTRCKSS